MGGSHGANVINQANDGLIEDSDEDLINMERVPEKDISNA